MSKIIIYGAGKMFQESKHRIDFAEVVCIADKNLFMTPIYGCNIIRPERIVEYKYDYIIVFSKWDFLKIKNELIDIGIEEGKIIHWVYYLYIMKYSMHNISEDSMFIMREWLSEMNPLKVLDVDGSITQNCLHISNKAITEKMSLIDNLETGKMSLVDKRLYNCSGKKLQNCKYDVIVCLDYFLNHSFNEWKSFFEETFELSRYMIVSVPYKGFNPHDSSWDNWDFEENSIIRKGLYNFAQVYIIDKNRISRDINIYVVTHKVFNTPPNEMYIPVFAGAGNDNPMGIQGEKVEDNITDLNIWINECTVLYWIWKHTSSHFVGLNHYRRYFSISGEADLHKIVTSEQIKNDLNKYDMLMAPAYDSYPFSLKEQMYVSVKEEAFEDGFYAIRNIIEKKYSDYLKDFDLYFDGHYMYPCNMFITNRNILNRYCEWLFNIIIDACHQFDVNAYDSYSQRMIGFMAERLFTLWIMHNNITVKEIPMVTIE